MKTHMLLLSNTWLQNCSCQIIVLWCSEGSGWLKLAVLRVCMSHVRGLNKDTESLYMIFFCGYRGVWVGSPLEMLMSSLCLLVRRSSCLYVWRSWQKYSPVTTSMYLKRRWCLRQQCYGWTNALLVNRVSKRWDTFELCTVQYYSFAEGESSLSDHHCSAIIQIISHNGDTTVQILGWSGFHLPPRVPQYSCCVGYSAG